MQVLFKSRHPQATDLRDLPALRAATLGLDGGPRAELQMSDVNGLRDGIDKPCQVKPKTDVARRVVVACVAGEWHTALN